MKILFMLLHDFRFAGWSLDQFLKRHHFSKEYAKRVSKRGYDVLLYILHQDQKIVRVIGNDGYIIKVFPSELYFPPFLSFGNSHSFKIFKEIKNDKPEVVHYHNYYLWSFPYISAWLKYNKIKFVAQYHGESERLKFLRMSFIPSLNLADKFLVALNKEIDYLVSKFKIPGEKILKFPNVGVDTELFRPLASKNEEPTLLYVGRMTLPSRSLKEKSPWMLINIIYELAKLRDDVKLLMIGDGPGLNYLKGMVEKKKLNKNVIFLSYVENIKLPAFYSRSWLSFIPMHLEDIDPFWDGSLKESLSCATPVIGFNDKISSLSEGRREYGYLVPSDPKIAARIIYSALKNEDDLEDKGKRGRDFVQKFCSWDRVIERLNSIYECLTSL